MANNKTPNSDPFESILSGKAAAPKADPFESILSGQAKSPTAATEAPGIPQTALEHYGNTLTGGYLPQLQAGAAKFILGDDYVKSRDENIARLKAEEEANPKTAFTAKAAGILTQAPLLAGVGNGIKGMAAVGGALGAAQNPGDTPGEADPLQYRERIANGLVGAGLGAGLGGLGAYAKNRAAVQPLIKAVKDPAELQGVAGKEFQSALKTMDESYIAPRMEKLKEVVSGKTIKVNADAIEAAGFPKEAAEVRQIAKQQAGMLTTGAEQSVADVPAEHGIKLRRMLDNANRFIVPRSGADVEAVARQQNVLTETANNLRNQINEIPGARGLNEETSHALTLRDVVAERARNPISAISPGKLSDKAADIQNFDKLAGTNLSKLVKRTAIAKSLLLDSSVLKNPLKAPGAAVGLVDRIGTEASPYLNKIIGGR